MPGLFSLVDELERRAIRWGVATASERWYAIRNLQNLGLYGTLPGNRGRR